MWTHDPTTDVYRRDDGLEVYQAEGAHTWSARRNGQTLETSGRRVARRAWGKAATAMAALDGERPAADTQPPHPAEASEPGRLTDADPMWEDADRAGPAGGAATERLAHAEAATGEPGRWRDLGEEGHDRDPHGVLLEDPAPPAPIDPREFRDPPECDLALEPDAIRELADRLRRYPHATVLLPCGGRNHRVVLEWRPDLSIPQVTIADLLASLERRRAILSPLAPTDVGAITDEPLPATDGLQAAPTTEPAPAIPPASADASQGHPRPSGEAPVTPPTALSAVSSTPAAEGAAGPARADDVPGNPVGTTPRVDTGPAKPAPSVQATPPPSSVVNAGPAAGLPAEDHWTVDAREMFLHKSHLAMLSRCELQYQFRYLDGIKSPPRASTARGIAAHEAVNVDLTAKVATGSLLSDDDVRDAAAGAFDRAWDGVDLLVVGSGIDPDEVKATGADKLRGIYRDQTIAAAGAYHTEMAPSVYPIENGLERPFRLKLKGLDFGLAGTIDIIEAGKVRDLKTASKAPSQAEADSALELTVYGLAVRVAEGRAPDELSLDKMVTTAGGKVYTRSLRSTRGPADYQALLKRAALAAKRIRSGVLMPAAPDSWACSSKWCGYWDTCPFGARGRTGRPISKGATP